MSNWIPSLYGLRAFEAVARHLSYKTAAEELNVTPAAVKQLVVKLERALGVRLVERQGHHLKLTPNGIAGQKDLELAMHHLSGSVQKMRLARQENRLIVTVEASIATTWLVKRLENFKVRHPNIDVLIDSSQRITDLQREDVDVAIRYGVPSEDGLTAKRLFEDLVLPACSPRLMEEFPELKSVEDLRSYPLIHWDLSNMPWAENTKKWFDWHNWFERRSIKDADTAKGLHFSDYGLAVQAALSGQGILLGGWPALQDPMQAGLLICPIPEIAEPTDIGFDIVTTEEAASRPEVSAFVDWVLGISGESPSTLFAG